MEIGPVSVRRPAEVTSEMVTGIAGTLAGLFGSEYVSTATVKATGATGDKALVAGVATKAALGLASWWATSKTTGKARTLLYLAGIGCFASAGLDILNKLYPKATARLAAKYVPPVRVVSVQVPTEQTVAPSPTGQTVAPSPTRAELL